MSAQPIRRLAHGVTFYPFVCPILKKVAHLTGMWANMSVVTTPATSSGGLCSEDSLQAMTHSTPWASKPPVSPACGLPEPVDPCSSGERGMWPTRHIFCSLLLLPPLYNRPFGIPDPPPRGYIRSGDKRLSLRAEGKDRGSI